MTDKKQEYFEKDEFFKQEYKLIPYIKIKYTGAVDFANFYKYLKYWLEDNSFISKSSEENGLFETRYTERTTPDGSKIIEIRWETSKNNDNLFLYKLDVLFLIMNAKDVEVQWGDVKRSLTKASYEIRLDGTLILDPSDKLKDYNFIKRWYYRSVMRKAFNYHKAYFYNKVYELQEAIKKFLRENSF